MKDYLNNLDRLVMYVDNKSKAEDASSLSGNMCGYVSKINGALYSHKIHVQCVRPQKGRYVRVEAWGSHNSWSRLFSAVLCEVLVYAWYLCIWSCYFNIFIVFLISGIGGNKIKRVQVPGSVNFFATFSYFIQSARRCMDCVMFCTSAVDAWFTRHTGYDIH